MQTTSKRQFSHSVGWADFEQLLSCGPYLKSLCQKFELTRLSPQISTASLLNQLADIKCVPGIPRFVDQQRFDNDPRYYEQLIADEGVVPCRKACWHDFFNGLIWLQFPSTKWLLNRLHMEDISHFGTHPRTPKRNRITHFDECGLILQVHSGRGRELLDLLGQHQWQDALHHQADAWGVDITPTIFGHANLEMLLNPFLSLTAKWIALDTQVEKDTDAGVCNRILRGDVFVEKGVLKPLPLLGIPGWMAEQGLDFYANKQVFRDKKSA